MRLTLFSVALIRDSHLSRADAAGEDISQQSP